MRISSKWLLGAGAALFSSCRVASFPIGGALSRTNARRGMGTMLWLTPEEERAALLSSYLAKAHEGKLKAVREVEEKKDAEISVLKAQLREATAPGPVALAASAAYLPPVGTNVEALSREELVAVAKSYQQFMAKYIVDAQEEKTHAVKTAEAAVAQRYNEWGSAASTTEPAPEPVLAAAIERGTPAATPVVSTKADLYSRRNARLVASAAVGKSRWGQLEVDRAVFLADKTKIVNKGDGPHHDQVQAKVQAVTAHVSTDRTNRKATRSGPADVIKNLFQQRNEKIAAAAMAGKSRWGDLELLRIKKSVAVELPSKAADIPVADYGLQSDQGATLADRVNLGARLMRE